MNNSTIKAVCRFVRHYFYSVFRATSWLTTAPRQQLSSKKLKLRVTSAAYAMAHALAVFSLVFVALLAPRAANAMSGYVSSVTANHTSSNLVNMCSNCHADWGGTGIGNTMRIDYYLWTPGAGSIPALGSNFYLTDGDMDGVSTGNEYLNSESATKPAQSAAAPNPLNNWFPNYADKDGDGCIQLFSRASESGTFQAALGFTTQAVVNSKSNYTKFAQNGWDIDDNDPNQGCSASATASAPGTTTDITPPAAISDFSVGSTPASGSIPLKWTAVGDDGMTGNAHDYDLRYTTESLASGNQLRDPASWATLRNFAGLELKDATWNTGGADAPLMRAIYEPLPGTPGVAQPCNALGFSALCAANPGASYVLASKGTGALSTNVLTNGTVYWLAVWTDDGVAKPSGTVEAPGTTANFTENSTLSNIIAVTAGAAGTTATSGVGISSISPTTLTGATSPATVTVAGYGLNQNANQVQFMYLTNSAGTVIAQATSLSCNGMTCTGVFGSPIPNGTYNLELRNGTGTANTKAAWVNAVTVNILGQPSPTLLTVSPNSRGAGAQNQCILFSGANFNSPFTVNFSNAGITVNSVTVNSTTSATVCISISPATASGTGTVSVNADGQSSNTVPFTVTTAPVIVGPAPPNGNVGVPYSYTCSATGGVPPYVWSVTGLPPGLTFNASTCVISGTPTTGGTFAGSLTVTDANAGTSSLATTITVQGGANVDLVMTAVSTTTTSVGTGTYFVIDNTETNQGTTNTTAADNIVIFYLSVDATITTSDIGLVGSRSVSSLAAGERSSASTSVFARSSTMPGTYYIGACADVTNVQPETNEANNCTAGGIITIGVDVKINQTIGMITFTPASLTVGGTTTANATATSGLAVTFTSLTPAVCTVAGSTVTGITAGTCTIAADQAGDASYNAAPQVTQSLAVTVPAVQPVITSSSKVSGVVNQPFSYQITATGNPTSYAASLLPEGLTLNTGTGLISGTPVSTGRTKVDVSATNTAGTDSLTVTINISRK